MALIKPRQVVFSLFLSVVWVGFGYSEREATTPALDPQSVIHLTYRNNLQVAASRYRMEAAQFEFERFERNLSQFIPFIFENRLDHETERFRDPIDRVTNSEGEISTYVGVEKEFFDGRKIAVGMGARSSSKDGLEAGNPFIETEVEVPLFSSFTRLERITERNFEESQMLESWLSFIETIQETSENSQERYFNLLQAKHRHDIALLSVGDMERFLKLEWFQEREADRIQVEDLQQFFQSEAVGFSGEIESKLIELMDVTGIPHLKIEEVVILDFENGKFYGEEYFTTPLDSLIEKSIQSDVRMRILEIAKENAELKRKLSIQGKWEIIGKFFGRYDFPQQGDDFRETEEYQVGVSLDIQRNDPRLLGLSRQQAEAEIRQSEAQVNFRRRQLFNLIRRLTLEANSILSFVGEVKASRNSRRALFESKREEYLNGKETIDDLLSIRQSLYHLEGDYVEAVHDLYQVVVELDSASGLYFRELSKEITTSEMLGSWTNGEEVQFP